MWQMQLKIAMLLGRAGEFFFNKNDIEAIMDECDPPVKCVRLS